LHTGALFQDGFAAAVKWFREISQPVTSAGFPLPDRADRRSYSGHGNENDLYLGWAHVSVDGGKLMPDDNRDLCEICSSPLQRLMKKVHEEAREKRNSSSGA
jgi:hypothetical protein